MSDPRPARSDASGIESVLQETRLFDPPAPESVGMAFWHVASMEQYRAMHRRSLEDPEGFWGEVAGEMHWFSPWERVLEWTPPDAKWFVGGTTNLCYNCVDRQVQSGHGDDVAIIWEGEPLSPLGGEMPAQRTEGGLAHPYEIRRLTYADLQRETARMGNVLKGLGVVKGDVVTIYMGMVPELAVAMLACARIGAVHSVIFGGFSAQAIIDRVHDADSKIIITCDGGWRRGKVVPLKDNVDQACTTLAGTPNEVRSVVVVRRCGNDVAWQGGRDHWWHDLIERASGECPCEAMDAEDSLFLLYTSGSTGKPKGILHTTGGYMVYTYLSAKHVFNLIPDAGQVYWCTADIGWVTGHSYIVYGILPNRVPTLMYEGAPNFPGEDRFWDIVQRHTVTQFYTAPTAIRAFMKWGEQHPAGHDLSSLKVLGTVGEPINPEAWMWYHRVIGGGRCPITDTWWQTETGGQLIMPLPGATPTKPGSCAMPFFGVDAAILSERGEELPPNSGGLLAIRRPWPAMLRSIYGDHQRYIDTYWSTFNVPAGASHSGAGVPPAGESGTLISDVDDESDGQDARPTCSPYYFAGDGARMDEDGYFWIMGRVDDVINVSGHRLGTMEVESALVSHPAVVEAAVVGMPHEIKGTGIAAFCTLAPNALAALSSGAGVPPETAAPSPLGGEGRGEGSSSSRDREQAQPDEGGSTAPDPAALERLKDQLRAHVAKEIGAIAKPDQIRFTDALPKTRSGKIMRRLLRSIAAGEARTTQDTTTLEDYSVLARLRESEEG